VPDKEFWSSFPSRQVPTEVQSQICVESFKKEIDCSSEQLTFAELSRAKKCISYLTSGAPAFQKSPLGPCSVKNSKDAYKFGEQVTDSIASWIKKGFVAGPFESPPFENFRSNSILAIPQSDKVRICINVSLPKEANLNSNVNKFELEKIEMTSAKLFSYSILDCGTGCRMWKFDFQDAYKNVPVPLSDLRLQGFRWLGAYFVELKQMFGAAASVQNFDILGNTIKACCLTRCSIPSKLVHRQLDDVPVVAPRNSNWGPDFENVYRKMCNDINVKLAPDCPNFEKAFSNSCFGKVLGINFNTENLTWSLPKEKNMKCIALISNVENKDMVTLLDMQQLMGNLNHVSQMAPFLSTFRFNLNKTLASCIVSEPVRLSDDTLNELTVWRNFLMDKREWWPICRPQLAPPICTKTFFTDAAGMPRNKKWSTKIGCGVLGVNEVGDTILTY
jgi:hypothetical protein